MTKKLLEDVQGNATLQLVEDKERPDRVIVRGEFARCGVPTANKRIYSEALWRREINKLREQVKQRSCFGELDHPSDGKTKLQRASHLVTDLEITEDGVVIGEMEILDTQKGKDVKAIYAAGGRPGTSSRGFGSVVRNDQGFDDVQEDFNLLTWDIVADPANVTSYPEVVKSPKAQAGMEEDKKKEAGKEDIKESSEEESKEEQKEEKVEEELVLETVAADVKKMAIDYKIPIQDIWAKGKELVVKFAKEKLAKKFEKLWKAHGSDTAHSEKDPESESWLVIGEACESVKKMNEMFDAFSQSETPDEESKQEKEPEVNEEKNNQEGGNMKTFTEGFEPEKYPTIASDVKKFPFHEDVVRVLGTIKEDEDSRQEALGYFDGLKESIGKSNCDKQLAESAVKEIDTICAKIKPVQESKELEKETPATSPSIRECVESMDKIEQENSSLKEENEQLKVVCKDMGFSLWMERNLRDHPRYKNIVESIDLTKVESLEQLKKQCALYVEDVATFKKQDEIENKIKIENVENENKELKESIKSLQNEKKELLERCTEMSARVYMEQQLFGNQGIFEAREAFKNLPTKNKGNVDLIIESFNSRKNESSELFKQVRSKLGRKENMPENLLEETLAKEGASGGKIQEEFEIAPGVVQSAEEITALARG